MHKFRKSTEKELVKEARKFWKQYGKATGFLNWQSYLDYVLKQARAIKKMSKKRYEQFVETRKKYVLEDLQRQEGLVNQFLKDLKVLAKKE